MNKKKIYLNYKKKINLFKKHNKAYYDLSQPTVSDKDYDDLKKEILQLEEKYKFLESKFSPKNMIGHKPSKNFKKSLHKVPMLSLGNAFSEEELINFEKKITNFL